jgi:Tat protein translocase TatB subunit
MLNIGPQELLLILVVALLVVGPRRLPELGRSLGKGLREIRKAQSEVRKTIQIELDDEPRPASASARGSSARLPREDSDGEAAGPEGDGAAPAAAAQASTVGEVSKTLGRSLAELRRARQEIQRSFRVDLDAPTAAPRPSAKSPRAPAAGTEPPASEPEGSVAPDAALEPE